MNNYFLVDFENVHEDGFKGIEHLTEGDVIDVFYTQNANKISFDYLNIFMSESFKAKLLFHEVKTGKQSLDFQLSAHLGVLIGINGDKEQQYYIVSKDKGFLNVVEFLDTMYSKKVYLQNNLMLKKPVVAIEHENATENAVNEETQKLTETSIAETKEIEENQIAKTDVIPSDTKEKEEKPTVKAIKRVKRSPKNTKTAIKKEKLSPELSMELNNNIQQVLSQAKFDSDTIAKVAKFVGKNITDIHAKNVIYQELIKTHGRKKGLEVYNAIKETIMKFVNNSEETSNEEEPIA